MGTVLAHARGERIVQRGIDSYVLHTDQSRVRIETLLKEKRIGGPRDLRESKWDSLDRYLLEEAWVGPED